MEKIKIEIDSLFGDIEAVGDSNRSSKSLPKMGFNSWLEYDDGKHFHNLF